MNIVPKMYLWSRKITNLWESSASDRYLGIKKIIFQHYIFSQYGSHISSRTDRNFIKNDNIFGYKKSSRQILEVIRLRLGVGEVCAVDPSALVVHKTVDKT